MGERVFLALAQNKSYKIWILFKLNLKNGNQKIIRVGYVSLH